MLNKPLILSRCLALILGSALSLATPASEQSAGAADWTIGGHSKYQYIHTWIPHESVLHDISGDRLQDQNLEVRLKASARRERLDFEAHMQVITAHSDTLFVFRELPGSLFSGNDVINDNRRWFNLTHDFHNQGKNATLARLDRINVGYTGDKIVLRFGRQAISWGNGLLFTPMDILNPFDPSAVDKEYKTGDDMLYSQYLLDSGNDVQAVGVVRRNPVNGEVENDLSSLAVKYHGFLNRLEYDILLSEHYGETLLGLGASADLGGAVWRGDLVWNDTNSGWVLSAVAGISYSWVTGGHNWTGFLEYYYNGFGQTNGDYSAAALAGNPELLRRLVRGELFNLARHYLGVSVTMEVTPLLYFTPNLFVNITDPSALAQLVLSYDWKQDLQVLAAFNLPTGPNGSEYGGIEAVQTDRYVSTGPSLFVQLAWYF